jgi:hypothetical protein
MSNLAQIGSRTSYSRLVMKKAENFGNEVAEERGVGPHLADWEGGVVARRRSVIWDGEVQAAGFAMLRVGSSSA